MPWDQHHPFQFGCVSWQIMLDGGHGNCFWKHFAVWMVWEREIWRYYSLQVLKVYHYPATITMVQFAVGSVLVLFMWTFNLYKRPKLSRSQVPCHAIASPQFFILTFKFFVCSHSCRDFSINSLWQLSRWQRYTHWVISSLTWVLEK